MVGLLACVIVESFEKVATASSNSRIVIKINFCLSFEQIHSVCGPNGNDLKQKLGQLQVRDWCLGSMV